MINLSKYFIYYLLYYKVLLKNKVIYIVGKDILKKLLDKIVINISLIY
jgi:hypothetical protein